MLSKCRLLSICNWVSLTPSSPAPKPGVFSCHSTTGNNWTWATQIPRQEHFRVLNNLDILYQVMFFGCTRQFGSVFEGLPMMNIGNRMFALDTVPTFTPDAQSFISPLLKRELKISPLSASDILRSTASIAESNKWWADPLTRLISEHWSALHLCQGVLQLVFRQATVARSALGSVTF